VIDIGHTVFHWTNGDKHFLIPGHAIHLDDGEWDVHMHAFSDPRAPLARLVELPVDYLLPGRTKAGDQDYFAFTERSRGAYQRALRDSLRPTRKSLEASALLVSNYISAHLESVINELGLFATHHMPGGNTGKIDILLNSLELADVFFFHDFKREFGPKHKFWKMLHQHVETGGALFVSDARHGVNSRCIAGGHPFPEISTWGGVPENVPGDELTICEGHPAIGKAPAEAQFACSFYNGTSLEPGERGSVLVRNASGKPVAVAGEVGKGRVVFGSFFYHPHMDPVKETQRQLVEGILRWLAGN
jgi:hypothetical protein